MSIGGIKGFLWFVFPVSILVTSPSVTPVTKDVFGWLPYSYVCIISCNSVSTSSPFSDTLYSLSFSSTSCVSWRKYLKFFCKHKGVVSSVSSTKDRSTTHRRGSTWSRSYDFIFYYSKGTSYGFGSTPSCRLVLLSVTLQEARMVVPTLIYDVLAENSNPRVVGVCIFVSSRNFRPLSLFGLGLTRKGLPFVGQLLFRGLLIVILFSSSSACPSWLYTSYLTFMVKKERGRESTFLRRTYLRTSKR